MRALTSAMALLAVTGTVAGCVVAPPAGPRVAVMPGPSKSIEQFQQDDGGCRQYALQQTGFASPAALQQNSTAAGAAIGTLAGAAAGAAIGAAAGNPAAGAAIGAGSGLVLGTAAGSSQGYATAYEAQRAYDIAYQQCMVAKGNSLPPPPPAPPAVVYSYPPPPVVYYDPPPYWYGGVYWGHRWR